MPAAGYPIPQGVVLALRECELDPLETARALGLPVFASDGHETLGAEDFARVLEHLSRTVRRPLLGVEVGLRIRPELMGVLGIAAISAPSFGAAILRCAQYKRLLSLLHIELKHYEASFGVTMSFADRTSPSTLWQLDSEIAFLAGFGRKQTASPVEPCEVRLRRGREADARAYENELGCPVYLTDAHDEIRYSQAAFDAPLLAANAELYQFVTKTADRQLEETSAEILSRVGAAIRTLLPEGDASVRRVARRVGMSERSLQRALSAKGTTFSKVCDDTREALARTYVEEGRYIMAEVSYLVGFSTPQSFYRAFRRWTGTSPENYGRLHARGAA